MTSLRTVTQTQALAFELMRKSLEAGNAELAAAYAQCVRACSSIRIAGMPARSVAHFGTDPLDTIDPPESEAEYVEREIREARG